MAIKLFSFVNKKIHDEFVTSLVHFEAWQAVTQRWRWQNPVSSCHLVVKKWKWKMYRCS